MDIRDKIYEEQFTKAVDAILVIDVKGVIVMHNDSTLKMFGYEEEGLIGRKINDLMPTHHSSHHDSYINNYVRTGSAKIIGIGRDVFAMRKDGSQFPIRLCVSQLAVDGDIYFLGMIHDISENYQQQQQITKLNAELESKVEERTEELAEVVNKLLATNQKLKREINERKKAEEALQESENELRQALKREQELGELKSRFVSMASHEFRTPLSTILSSVSLIAKYTETAQQENRDKHIERIKNAVNLLNDILGDFLSLSRLEEGQIKPEYCCFELNTFMKDIFEELEAILKPGQRIICEAASLKVDSDKKLLRQVVVNLLSNAIKYSPNGTDVTIRVVEQADSLLFEVADQGIGIPEPDQVHLFDRFFRASNATNIQGTGLGLNILKKHLELLGGNISFVSQMNKGSTFKALVPKSKVTPSI